MKNLIFIGLLAAALAGSVIGGVGVKFISAVSTPTPACQCSPCKCGSCECKPLQGNPSKRCIALPPQQ